MTYDFDDDTPPLPRAPLITADEFRELSVKVLMQTPWREVSGSVRSNQQQINKPDVTRHMVYVALGIPKPGKNLTPGVSTDTEEFIRVSDKEIIGKLAAFYRDKLAHPDPALWESLGIDRELLAHSLETMEEALSKTTTKGWKLCWALPLVAVAIAANGADARAEAGKASYCLSLYGECKYKADFKHFDYVNPDAPKGGSVKLAETGTYDNLNPFILKGVKAPGIGDLFESLMVQSMDEPQSMYGLVAESVTVAADNSSVEFTLRKEAKWHDGTPITPDDVVFSFDALKNKGDPSFKIMYTPVSKCEKTGERTVKFTFADAKNRELPMIVAQMPLVSKAYYSTHDFEKTTLEAPMGSGPYEVDKVDQGRSITYKRVENYWAKDLPVMRGMYNFNNVRVDMYRDENVTLEALKAGEYDFRQEYIARNWATAYDAPAVKDGRIIKREIKHEIPQGMQAFIFNTRKAKFADARVREAIGLSLDYEWENKTIFYGAYVRNVSFFENTEFQSRGTPKGKELELLKPFEKELPPELFAQEFKNPVTDGSGNARESLLKAQKLLDEAGWKVKDGKRVNDKGEQLSIEFLLRQPTMERVIGPMRKNLERLGVASSIRNVDDSQYQKRTDEGDFDTVSIWINRGLFFPGNEQTALWNSSQADVKGSNNLGGVKSKVVDAMLDALTKSKDKDNLVAAGRALDRVLLWEYYVIPHWHSNSFRVAYWDKFGIPAVTPKYNLGFQTWWAKDTKKAANSGESAKP